MTFTTVNHAPDAPVLNAPADDATGVASPVTLDVSVSDSDADPLTVTYFGRRKAVAGPDFTLVAIPDTQHYVDDPARAATFTAQTNWIVNNRAPLNIAFASHLGDIVENNDQFIVEWQRADASFSVLEANDFPFGMSPGNHDQNRAGVAAFYDQFFPPSRFLGQPWYGGYLGAEAGEIDRLNKDNYELFSAGGIDFLIIHIETDWPNYAVDWADKIINRYPNRRVILSTHAFLNTSSARPTGLQFRPRRRHVGRNVWQQLIKPNCNVFMVINGHYPGEGRRTDLNDCGQPVHQVLTDYQEPHQRRRRLAAVLHVQAFGEQDLRLHVLADAQRRRGGVRDGPSARAAASSSSTTTCRRRSRSSRRVTTSRPDRAPRRCGAGSRPAPSTSGTSRSTTAGLRPPGRCGASRPRRPRTRRPWR